MDIISKNESELQKSQFHQNGHAATAKPEYSGASNGNHYPDVFTPAIATGELHEKHRAMLRDDSALSDEAIQARGYFTSTNRQQLQELGFAKNQCLVPALVIPLYNWRGECVSYSLRPDIPRNGSNGNPIKYETPAKQSPTLDVAPLTASQICDPSQPLIITEGAKKADAASTQGLCAINLNGVYGFRGKNAQGGMIALPDWENIALNGRAVFIAYDSDVATKSQVESALRRLCAFLQQRGAIVKVVYLPEGESGEKTGLDDFFARGGKAADLFVLARDLEAVEESKRKKKEAAKAEKLVQLNESGLPIIETNGRQLSDELRDLSAAIENYNAQKPRVFHGIGGLGLVRIEEEISGKPRIKSVTRDAAQGIAGEAAKWISTSEREGIRDVAPSRDLCSVFLQMPEVWKGIPIVEKTASAPFFAPDGTLCATHGYHAAARTWLSLEADFQLPDTVPTPENVEAAKALLLNQVLGEVSFADEASKAHALAQAILPFVRLLIHGQTPLHLWSAPLRGSGKSYAASLCILPFATPTATPEKTSPEEWRKSILCELVTGPSHVFLDNIKGALNSSALDSAITEEFIRDRLTGTGEMVTAKTNCVWVATANNANLTEDAATRSLVIRLDPNSENPDQRVFKSDPKAFIKANRGIVCGAIITLVRAWQEAGAPSYSGRHHWRFPKWQNIIGGILEANGIGGFLDNLATEQAFLSTGGDGWAEMVEAWWENHGDGFVTTDDLLPIAEKIPSIAAALEKSEGGQRAQKFMGLMRGRRDRVYGELKIVAGGNVKIKRKSTYRLQKIANVQTAQTVQTDYYNAREPVFLEKNDEKTQKDEKLRGFALYSDDSAQSAQSAHTADDVEVF